MKRIHMHWTAGGHTPNHVDLEHYHRISDGNGNTHVGKHPIRANARPIGNKPYAAHTRKANTDAIGVSMAAMRGAKESPFDPGTSPITTTQLDGFVKMVAELCEDYDIPVTRETVLTHAEVQPTLGVKQRFKWDITWLPGMEKPGDPIVVGDVLRKMIKEKMQIAVDPTKADTGPIPVVGDDEPTPEPVMEVAPQAAQESLEPRKDGVVVESSGAVHEATGSIERLLGKYHPHGSKAMWTGYATAALGLLVILSKSFPALSGVVTFVGQLINIPPAILSQGGAPMILFGLQSVFQRAGKRSSQ